MTEYRTELETAEKEKHEAAEIYKLQEAYEPDRNNPRKEMESLKQKEQQCLQVHLKKEQQLLVDKRHCLLQDQQLLL